MPSVPTTPQRRPSARQRLRRPPGGAGLAVGAGDGDHAQRRAGPAEEGVGDRRRPRPSGRAARRCARRRSRRRPTPSASTRQAAAPAASAAGTKRRPSVAWPGQAMKASPGCTLAAVGAQRAAHARGQPARGGVGRAVRRVRPCLRSSPARPRTACGDDLRLDVEVRRHVHHAQRLLHHLAEHRRGHVAAVVHALARLVDHHRDDDARVARSAPCRRTRRGTCCRVALAFLLVRGAGLAAHRIADGLRLAARCRRGRRPAAASRAPRCAVSATCTRMPAAGCVLALSMRHRDQLAVAREHGVGARQLEQRGRQAVAVAHRRLLDRPPGLVRAAAGR